MKVKDRQKRGAGRDVSTGRGEFRLKVESETSRDDPDQQTQTGARIYTQLSTSASGPDLEITKHWLTALVKAKQTEVKEGKKLQNKLLNLVSGAFQSQGLLRVNVFGYGQSDEA